MKKVFSGLLLFFAMGCGDARSFEGKNIFGSQSSTGTSSTGGGWEPEWPQGDSGVGLLQIIPEDMQWEGFRQGQQSYNKVTLEPRDWYDPTGIRGVDALLIITTKHQCDKCAEEAGLLAERISSWKSENKRIKVVLLVVDNEKGKAATLETALKWRTDYFLVDADVGIDPLALMLPDVVFGMPYHTVVDPRTMTVVETQEGIIGDYKVLEDLSNENK